MQLPHSGLLDDSDQSYSTRSVSVTVYSVCFNVYYSVDLDAAIPIVDSPSGNVCITHTFV